MVKALLLVMCALLLPAGAQTLVTHYESGPRAERVNIVMLSEGYTAAQLASGKFSADMTKIANAFFAIEPHKSYKPFFNVYGIAVASTQSGGDLGVAGGYVNTYFNATFNSYGIDRLLTIDSTGYTRAYALLNTHVPEYDIVMVVVNDTKYGGSGGSIAVTSTNTYAPDIAIHEIGHSFAGLGDEYDYAGSSPSEDPNTTQQTNRSLIKWNHWINASTPIPTPETSTHGNGKVGLFEGAAYNPTGWYRPTLTSMMQALGEPFYAVNEEAIMHAIYGVVSPITSVTPATSTVTANVPNQTLNFAVNGPNPAATAPQMTVEWRLNGNVISGQTTRTLMLNALDAGNGSHTLIATVRDVTPKVRSDPTGLLTDSRTWTINVTNQGPSAPTGLLATAMLDGSVNLAWTDSSPDEAGFVIERQVGTSTTYSEAGRVAANVTAFTDAGTTPGASTKYRVKGVNSFGPNYFGMPSNVVTVMPLIAPGIVQDPLGLARLQGTAATFSVQATGTALRYQWRFKGNAILNAKSSTYSIAAVQSANAGGYDCVVTNDIGIATSATAVLVVETKPAITLHPLSQTVFSDQPTTFTVQATGIPMPQFQWRKGGTDMPGAMSATLTLSSPDVRNAGSYDCRVTNVHGSVISKPAVLSVLGPPVITTQPVSATITRGMSAVFSVIAQGTATLIYQWRKNGVAITGATKNSYLVNASKDSDAGSFDCIVSNSYGRVFSTPATLSFTVGTVNQHFLAGARAGTAKWKWMKRFGGTNVDTATALMVNPGNTGLAFGGLSRSTGIKLDALPASDLGAYVGYLDTTGRALAIRALDTPTSSTPGTVGLVYPFEFGMAYLAAATTFETDRGLVEVGQFFGDPGFPPVPQHSAYRYADIAPECVTTNGTNSHFIGGYAPVVPPISHHPMVKRVNFPLPGGLGGTASWTRIVTSAGSQDAVLAITRLSSGNIVIAGTAEYDANGQLTFENSASLSALVLNGTAGTQTGFIACYTESGDLVWAKTYGQSLNSLVVESSGAIWCAGSELGPVAVALKINPANGNNDQRIPVNGGDGLAVASCSGGDIALLVRMTNASAVGVESYLSLASGCAVMKFSPTGALQWVLPAYGAHGDAYSSMRARLAAGSDGSLYAALTFFGDVNVGSAVKVEFPGLPIVPMVERNTEAFIASISEVPQITAPPAHQIVALGQPLHLAVTARGLAGTVTYQWLKDGKVLAGQTASTLDIAISKLTDAGSYACRVAGNGGSLESAKAVVNIVDTTARMLKAPVAKPLDLPVSASGTGLSFTWWKNGVRVFNVGGFLNTTTGKLRISAMSTLFADGYVCKVTGPAGTLDVPFTAAVLLPPVFTPPMIPASMVSGLFDLQLSASDAATYRVLNLPAGLAYSASTGRITGKPTVPGPRLITVTATNAAGTSSPALTFTLNVLDLPAHTKGTHQGLLSGQRPWLNDLDGLLTLSVSGTGVVTGSLRTAVGTFTLVGSVDADPVAQSWSFRQRITRTGKPAFILTANSANAMTNLFTGVLIEEPAPADVSAIAGHRNIWSSATPATAQAGTYNATLQASAGVTGVPPLLPGSLKTIITAMTGVGAWSGKLGDNVALSGSGYLSPSATVMVWQSLYSNQGQLSGNTIIISPAINGTLQWKRKQVGTGVFWSDAPTVVTGTKAP